MGEDFCASFDMTDEDACKKASEACLSWWQKMDEVADIDDSLFEMSEQRINELASDPWAARAYLAEGRAD